MKNRIQGYDLARAFAVIGMVIVNFKVVMGAVDGPHWLKTAAGTLEGRAAAAFVILAGIGVSLLTRSARESEDRIRINEVRIVLIKRAVLLFLVGLSYSFLWPADILHFYGLYILIGAFFIAASDKVLKTLAAVFIIVFVVLLFFIDYETGWNWETLHYSGFYTVAGMFRHLLYNGFHPVFPWTAFLFIGMWLGRRNVSDPAIRKKILIYSVLIAAISELTSKYLIGYLTEISYAGEASDITALLGTKPMPPMPLYITAASGTAISLVIICIMAAEKFKDSFLLKPLIYTGQLALTIYVAHVVFGMGGLYFMGRLFGQTITFAVISALIFNVSAILFSYFWRKRFRTGPLEWIFRKAADFKLIR